MYRPRRIVFYQALAFVAAAAGPAGANITGYGIAASNQLHAKTVVYEPATTYAQTPAAVAPEVITADKYHVALAVPTRRRVDVGNLQNWVGFPVQPQAQDQRAWARGLDLPVRRKAAPYTALGYAYFLPVVAETITVDKWYEPLTTPVRAQRSLFAQQLWAYANFTPTAEQPGDADLAFGSTSPQVYARTVIIEPDAYCPFTPVAAPEVVTVDKWYRPLDLPTRRRLSATAEEGSIFGAPPRAEANDQVAWHRQLDWPARRKLIREGIYSAAPPLPQASDAVGWHTPFSEPLRTKRLSTGVYQFEARPSLPVVPWGWYAELERPTRLKKSPAFQLSYTFVAAAPGAGVAYNWFDALTTPTRARKLYEFPATAIPVYFVPETPGPGFEINWWPPLNEPLRPKRFVAQQQGLTVPPALLTVTLEYGWHQRLTEPTRLKRRVNYEALSFLYQVDFAELVTVDKWFRELDRPQYRKRVDRPALAQGNINPLVPLAWQQLHTPLRVKGRIEYLAFTRPIYPFAFPGTGVGTNQPWPALSEPVRFSPRLRPSQQQFLSHASLLISSDLDPACRVIDVFDGRVISSSSADDVVVAAGQSDLTPSGPDDDLTPVPGNIVKVKC